MAHVIDFFNHKKDDSDGKKNLYEMLDMMKGMVDRGEMISLFCAGQTSDGLVMVGQCNTDNVDLVILKSHLEVEIMRAMLRADEVDLFD